MCAVVCNVLTGLVLRIIAVSVCIVSGFKRRLLDPKNTLPRNLEVIEITCKVQH